MKMTAFAQQTVDLNGVTFGFAAGYKFDLDKTYEYALSPGAQPALKIQPISKQSFVISSVVMVKLGKVAADQKTNQLVRQSNVYGYQVAKTKYENSVQEKTFRIKKLQDSVGFLTTDSIILRSKKIEKSADEKLDLFKKGVDRAAGMRFIDHLSINLGLNMIDISNDVSFNKTVNGGIGMGYFITPNLQAAVFYDLMRMRQLREYVNSYKDSPIPNATGTYYNALDANDNNLFYNKTIKSISFKLIFSIANKKE